MNGPHHDMLRGGVPNMHQGLMGQPFMPPQPQQGQQTMQHNMGLLQNNQGGNPGLGLMGGQPGASNPNYPLNMQPGRRPVYMTQHPGQHPNGPALNAAGGAGPSHMAGLAPNQLQSMAGFSGANMQTIRRVQSQPMVGQAGAHAMPGMQPGMMGGGMGMNGQPMNGQPSMNAMRQQQMQMQMRQHQQSSSQGGGMSPDNMGMPMNRPGQMQGANGIPPHARTPSGQQLMPTLQHAHGMPQQMQHNAFASSMSMPHQHQQSQLGSSPHVGSSGQQQPNMAGALAGNTMPPQPTNRAQMTSDNNMFINFPPPMQPQLTHNVPRVQMSNMNNAPFNIQPSPAPLNPSGDMSQRGPSSMDGSGPLTPAQVIGMGGGGDNFAPTSYGIGPGAAPARPPSHNGPHAGYPMSQAQPNLPSQQSPRQPDRLPTTQMHPSTGGPRPQSQPQAVHRQSPIPPATSRTPHVSQSSLPMNASGMHPPARIPPPASGQSPPGPSHPPAHPPAAAPSGSHSTQIAPRPGTGSGAPVGAAGPTASTSTVPLPAQNAAVPERSQPTPVPAPTAAPPPPPATAAATAPPQPQPQSTRQSSIYPVGFGQCFGRILQFSGQLAQDNNERLKMSYWNRVVQTYFSEKATIKLTLWKDNQQVEAKPFEIGYPIFPRFFCVTAQSGVKSQTITIDGARERLINPSRAIVECANAAWTFRYTNGYSITLRGPFTAEIIVQPGANPPPPRSAGMPQVALNYDLMFERLQFDAFFHDKYIAFDSIIGERRPDSPSIMPSPTGNPNGSDEAGRYDSSEPRYLIDHAVIPAEPINAFGIPQATMRCLELAESVAQMSDLIHFSVSNKLGPVAALSAYAEKLRRERALSSGPLGPNGIDGFPGSGGVGPPTHPEGPSGVPAQAIGLSTSFGTLGNMPGPSQLPPSIDAQGALQTDGPSKQAKAAPQPAQASGSTPIAQASTPASAPTPGGSTTPSMANASLKRKAPPSARSGEDSPTTANADGQQPAKKNARKRGRTQGS